MTRRPLSSVVSVKLSLGSFVTEGVCASAQKPVSRSARVTRFIWNPVYYEASFIMKRRAPKWKHELERGGRDLTGVGGDDRGVRRARAARADFGRDAGDLRARGVLSRGACAGDFDRLAAGAGRGAEREACELGRGAAAGGDRAVLREPLRPGDHRGTGAGRRDTVRRVILHCGVAVAGVVDDEALITPCTCT